jgi:hypothetical protein
LEYFPIYFFSESQNFFQQINVDQMFVGQMFFAQKTCNIFFGFTDIWLTAIFQQNDLDPMSFGQMFFGQKM